MSITHSTRSGEELVRLGREFLQRVIAPKLTPEDHGKYLAIAPDVEDYELADRDCDAVLRLIARHPEVKVSLERVGYPAAHKLRSIKMRPSE